MNHILDDPLSPTQQRSAPRTRWTRKVKAFQSVEFDITVTYWLCGDHYDGKMHIELMNCLVTRVDEDEGEPDDQLAREIAQDMLRDYYSDDKIVFE